MTPKPKWSRILIQQNLKNIPLTHLHVGAMIKENYALYSACKVYFGSYQKAIESIGLDYHRDVALVKRNYWNKERVIEELKKLPREELRFHNLHMNHGPLFKACLTYFGSIPKAFAAIGVSYDIKRNSWSKDEILRLLKQVPKEELNLGNLRANNPNLYTACIEYFGSYKKAVECLGHDYIHEIVKSKRNYWSRKRVQEELRKIPTDKLSGLTVFSERKDLYLACARRFGSYRKAVESIGVNYFAISKKNGLEDTIWMAWEYWCSKVVHLLYPDREILFNKCIPEESTPFHRPDYQIPAINLFIEAKTHPWINTVEKDLRNYPPYCQRLEFWCLNGERTSNNPNIVFKNSDNILEEIQNSNILPEQIENLSLEVNSMKSGFNPYEGQQQYLNLYQ